jgi:hypothetical protein
VQGPAGPPGNNGINGNNGTNGADGKTILNGNTNPGAAVGATGDFYINTGSNQIFGPKTAAGWGIGTSLVGPQGPPVTANFYGVYAKRTTISSSYPSFTQVTNLSQSVTITNVPAKVFITTSGNLETTSAIFNGSGCVIQVFNGAAGVPGMLQIVDVNDAPLITNTIGIWSMSGFVEITTPGTYTFSVKASKYAFDNFYAGGNTTAPAGLQDNGSLIIQVYY